jgi:predicted aldo/keto reductase-like oxidoreductase
MDFKLGYYYRMGPGRGKMKRKELGATGLMVSPLCFGTLAVSPLQKNFHPDKAAALFKRAYELGINFFDTAEIYNTYESLALTLRKYPNLIIAGRSYAVTRDDMRQSIERARHTLNRDYVDIFGLHEIESGATLKGHRGALEYLYEAKIKGIIKAISVSTHTIAGVRAGASETGIDVIHPLVNHRGIGIKDGGVDDMVVALRTAKDFRKGIYAMKILAGGHLVSEALQSFKFINSLEDMVDSAAVGIQSVAEIKLNILLISGQQPSTEILNEVAMMKRTLHIACWCRGCGQCVSQCNYGALRLKNGILHIDQASCLHCGYCVRVCPEFCLKIV